VALGTQLDSKDVNNFSKILERTENKKVSKMKYRVLGRTGMKISEIALGGHYNGVGWREKGSDKQERRNEVIGEAYKLGINFFDSNEVYESAKIGIALSENKIQRETIHLAADTNAYENVRKNLINNIVKDTINEVDRHIEALKTTYVDIFRLTTWSSPYNKEGIRAGVEAFNILKKDGKAKFFAISNHNPKDLLQIIDEVPEVDVLYIPYSYITNKAEEVFPVAKKKGIGIICIKPFVQGTFFNLKGIDTKSLGAVVEGWLKESDKTPEELIKNNKQTLALANLKYILNNENITTVIPGMETREEVRENVRASYEGKITEKEMGMLQNFWNNSKGENFINEMCSGNYHFLRQWRS
jgi:aryl-alcohol dehydrogenase-like predicted oxidoreductase